MQIIQFSCICLGIVQSSYDFICVLSMLGANMSQVYLLRMWCAKPKNNSVPPLAWPHGFPFQEVAPDLVADCPLAKFHPRKLPHGNLKMMDFQSDFCSFSGNFVLKGSMLITFRRCTFFFGDSYKQVHVFYSFHLV